MGEYLIPANSKKSMLIFGLFNKFDLILFGSGLALTTILLLALELKTLFIAILAMLPALLSGFLVAPVPNYHNILTVIISCIQFFTGVRKFKWKGWCVPHGEDEKK